MDALALPALFFPDAARLILPMLKTFQATLDMGHWVWNHGGKYVFWVAVYVVVVIGLWNWFLSFRGPRDPKDDD